MDVGGWLRRLGLEQYEAAFRENEIDDTVLPRLTAEDLRELGVGSVGHRRKLLDAIADLRTKASASDAPLATDTAAQDTAERRQVTVMFSDLVGSTALSARMDPEDLREIISAYQTCVANAVRRLGGFVAKYMGDGVLIYFGYPEAHEDDAERAVRAALEVIAAVGALKMSVSLQTRIGIATGLVVVGDLIGSGEAQERGIVGETPNLAARLQGVSEPNTVVIAEATRRLLGNLFDLRDLGPQELKGIAGPVGAFAVLRASSVASRFEAMHPGGLTALVGREEEFDLLLRRWTRAKNGDGQVVLISGEAGIGKSRLSTALMEGIAAEPHTRLRYFCSPQHTDSAFYPIIGQFERAAGFAHGDTPQTKLDKLDALLAQTSTSKQDVALFAEMLSLPNDGRYPALEPSPEQRRRNTLKALGVQLEAVARSSPVLMIFEDAQWTDPTSLEAFGRTVDQIAALRVLLIVTFRPEFEAPWVGQPHVTALAVNRLGHRDIGAMIDRVIGNKPLPVNVRKDIIERTDGIPLFAEEMTKAVLEAGGELEAMQSAVPSPALAVPASLHASLMARLDRLGPAKELAQIGAAIGREFSHALLATVVRKPEPELASLLDRLIRTGLLFRKGVPPQETYLFKHALVQDAAYGTLLRQPRRALHARIADTLEGQFGEIAEGQPEVLARHCTEAGLIEKAASLWGKAGRQSRARSALVEAAGQLTKALHLIRTLPPTPALRRQQVALQAALAGALIHAKGFAAPETIAAFTEAKSMIEFAASLGEKLDDPSLYFFLLFGLWTSKFVAFDGDAALERAQELSRLAEGTNDAALFSTRAMGLTLVLLGRFEAARMQLERGISVYVPEKRRAGDEPGAVLNAYHSIVMWLLGYPDTAMKDVETALRLARDCKDAAMLMYTLFHVCIPEILVGRDAPAAAHGQEVLSLAEEKMAPQWRAGALIIRGCTLSNTEPTAGAKLIQTGLDARALTGAVHLRPFFLTQLVSAYCWSENFEKARCCISEAFEAAKKTKEKWAEAEIHRKAGELALRLRQAEEAERRFVHSISIAREQRSKSWELRASMSLARLWRDQGKRDEARELLSPIYGWFTEGFDTLDLKQAKALLDELA